MTRGSCHHRRLRLRIAFLAVLALLFQQLALAAYACTPVNPAPASADMTAPCDGMPMPPDPQHPALCLAHCAQQAVTAQQAQAPTVPPLLMPALLPEAVEPAVLPVARATYAHTGAWRLSGMPPALRFRVLLI